MIFAIPAVAYKDDTQGIVYFCLAACLAVIGFVIVVYNGCCTWCFALRWVSYLLIFGFLACQLALSAWSIYYVVIYARYISENDSDSKDWGWNVAGLSFACMQSMWTLCVAGFTYHLMKDNLEESETRRLKRKEKKEKKAEMKAKKKEKNGKPEMQV